MTDKTEVLLSDCLKMVLTRWKMVVGLSAGAMILAALMAWRMPNVYEARIKLLSLASGIGSDLPGNNNDISTHLLSSMSLETLANLASAQDLMVQVVTELNLKDEKGVLWTSSQFSKNMTVRIEKGESGKKVNLPILTVAFQGTNPPLLKQLGDKWMEIFLKRNANLFATESAKSYEFIFKHYSEMEKKLSVEREQRRAYLVTNPLETEKSRRAILMGRYSDFFGQLQTKRAQLIGSKAKLTSAQKSIVDEPASLTLQRAVPSEAFWAIVGQNQKMDTLRAEALPDLVMRNQEHNNLYTALKSQITMTKIEVDTLEAEVAFLEKQVEAYQNEIEGLDSKIGKIDSVLSQLDREIGYLEGGLRLFDGKLLPAQLAKEQQEGFIRVVEAPIEPQVPVRPARMMIVIKFGVASLILGIMVSLGMGLFGLLIGLPQSWGLAKPQA